MNIQSKTNKRLKDRYGNWALVTGATSGIGKELALKLGKAGFNLIITGRRESLLQALSSKLFEDYQVEAIPIQGDLSDMESVKKLINKTAHLPIGVVILNAGFGTSGKFINADVENELNMIDLNCKAVMLLSNHFANKMRDQTKNGAIVLLSSMVAFQGVPYAANYAATKAYVQSFGEAIARELKSEGIDVLCAAPGPVMSGFAKRANMKMGITLTPESIAGPILKSIGKSTTILPGLLTKLLVYNLRLVPRWAKVLIMQKVMSGFTKHQKGR